MYDVWGCKFSAHRTTYILASHIIILCDWFHTDAVTGYTPEARAMQAKHLRASPLDSLIASGSIKANNALVLFVQYPVYNYGSQNYGITPPPPITYTQTHTPIPPVKFI